uniref:Uncharacterized protein n=1 Tax=Arundo donax TaxID=35708 RepID=A0A0A9EBZ5_ARUDO
MLKQNCTGAWIHAREYYINLCKHGRPIKTAESNYFLKLPYSNLRRNLPMDWMKIQTAIIHLIHFD